MELMNTITELNGNTRGVHQQTRRNRRVSELKHKAIEYLQSEKQVGGKKKVKID